MNFSPDERDYLIAAHLDGNLSADESIAFFQWLENDAEARSLLLVAAQQASALPRLSLGDLGEKRAVSSPVAFPRHAPRRLWKPFFAVAATLLIAAVLALRFLPETPAPISVISGTLAALERDGAKQSVSSALREGDHLHSGDETVILRWTSEDSELRLDPHSSLHVVTLSGRKRIILESGTLEAVIAHQAADGGLAVETESGSIGVVGTRFTVTIDATGTQVSVTDGSVRVQPRHGSTPTLLAAGFTTTVTSSAVSASRPISSLGTATTVSPTAISISAADFQAVQGKDWEGTLAADGIRSLPVADATVQRITMPVRRPNSYAVLETNLTCTLDISAEDACTLAMVAVCDAPDGSWMANIQGEQRIISGRQRVTFAFADFIRSAGSGSPVSSHGRIASLAIMTWSPDKPFVVHRCDIGAP